MKRWILGLLAGACLLAVPITIGCAFQKAADPVEAAMIAKANAARGIKTVLCFVDRPDLVFLNIAACILMTAATIGAVLLFVRPGVVSLWSVLGMAATAIALWTLRDFMKDYLWVLKLAGTFGLVLFGAAFAYGHRNWFEKVTNKDWDKDGDIGVDETPAPADPAEHPGAVS